MLKISYIGAGSLIFGETVLTDIFAFPALKKDIIICIEDIDAHRLDLMYKYLMKYREDNIDQLEGITIEKTTNQRKAIEEAKYIINSIQVGGLEAMKLDIDIPFEYGVTQCVGDTLGPGGVFRFLRTAPVMKSILEDIKNYGYKTKKGDTPLLLNYTNPMAMVTWYCNEIIPDSTVGLCDGVQAAAAALRGIIGAKPEDFSFFCAGINHMAWFLELWYKNSTDPESRWQDAYPLIKKAILEHPTYKEIEKLHYDMLNAVGYFMTESSGALSEYFPYYRKRKDLIEKYRGMDIPLLLANLKHGAYYDECVEKANKMEKNIEKKLARKKLHLKKKPSYEYASYIINAIETNDQYGFNGNVLNKNGGLITNLPNNCCVEVPIFADNHGFHPQGGIVLPTICQALNISNIMVQKAAVEGAFELNKEKIYHAVLLDPNTASVCSPAEVREMVDEMFEAEAKWLPQFQL